MPLDKLFPAQEESEKIIRVIRKHWFAYVIFWIVAILMLAPFVAVIVYFIAHQEDIAPVFFNLLAVFGPAYILFLLGLMVYGFIDHYFDIYIITDRRIIDISQNGFFKREISEVNLRQIQDVKADVDGVFPTLLHFGDVHIQTAGETPNFFFVSIPHPYEVSKKILDLHEAYVKERIDDDIELDDDGFSERPFNKEAPKFFRQEEPKEKVVKQSQNKQNEFEDELDEEGELREGKEVDL